MGQLPVSGGQERRATSPVERFVHPVAPSVHPMYHHAWLDGGQQPGGGAEAGRDCHIAGPAFGFHRRPEPRASFGSCGTTVIVVPGLVVVTPGPRSNRPSLLFRPA